MADQPLVPLFVAQDNNAISEPYFTGTLTEYNRPTVENTVEANGATYVNCPVVDPDVILEGFPVLLLKTPGRPIIVGRFIVPPV